MRRHALWLLAAVLLIGLWAWTQPSRNGAPQVPATTTEAGRAYEPSVTPARPPSTRPADSLLKIPPHRPADRAPGGFASYPAFLPREAQAVLADIARGGPYDYRQDGGVFQNRERRLPSQPRGYYREYTVPTPGADDRGPRRIVTGGGLPGQTAPHEYWYSDDHYRSFRHFDVGEGATR